MRNPSFNVLFFLLLFALSTALASVFLAWRLATLYALPLLPSFIIILGGCLAFLFVSFYEWHKASTRATRLLLKLLAVYLGTVFFAFMIAIIEAALSLALPTARPLLPAFSLAALIVLVLYSHLLAAFPKTKRITLKLKNLKAPLRVVQVSDLHLGAVRTNNFLVRIVKKLNALNPDAILITGDTLDGSGGPSERMVEAFKHLKPKAFAVLGNHDAYAGPDKAQRLLEAQGVSVLRGRTVSYKGLQLAGLDCPSHTNWQEPEPAMLKLKAKKGEPLILLYHTPNGLQEAQAIGADLMLCGHTHAGQLYPMYHFIRTFFRYTYGLHKIGSMRLYVTCGTGTWGPPMRLGWRAELVEFTLEPTR